MGYKIPPLRSPLLRRYYADPHRSKTNIIPFSYFRVHVQLGAMSFHLLTEILGGSNRLHRHRSAANEAILTKKTHLTKSPLPPWCITWHIIGHETTITIPTTPYPTQNFVLNPFLTSAGSESQRLRLYIDVNTRYVKSAHSMSAEPTSYNNTDATTTLLRNNNWQYIPMTK